MFERRIGPEVTWLWTFRWGLLTPIPYDLFWMPHRRFSLGSFTECSVLPLETSETLTMRPWMTPSESSKNAGDLFTIGTAVLSATRSLSEYVY